MSLRSVGDSLCAWRGTCSGGCALAMMRNIRHFSVRSLRFHVLSVTKSPGRALVAGVAKTAARRLPAACEMALSPTVTRVRHADTLSRQASRAQSDDDPSAESPWSGGAAQSEWPGTDP